LSRDGTHYATICTNEWRAQASGTQALTSGIKIEDYADDDDISFNFSNISQQNSVMNGIIHHQGAEVSKSWILLDNQSTVDVFCNLKLLKNIYKINKVMNIKCNAGVTRTNMVGDLPGYGQVWFNKDGITNSLLFSRVEEKCRITYDSAESKQFIVHKENRDERRFKQSNGDLFYLEAKKVFKEDGSVLVNTVKGNKEKYTKAAYKQATLVRTLQSTIGRPSAYAFLNIVEMNLLKDCPIVRADVLAAEDIFGPNLGSLRGETVRHSGDHARPEYGIRPSQDCRVCPITSDSTGEEKV
jgi:hypothetical protein